MWHFMFFSPIYFFLQVVLVLKKNLHIGDTLKNRYVSNILITGMWCMMWFVCEQAQSPDSLKELLNEKDNMGCSPLHYASREGHIRSLENLIRLGACINLKNNNNESPLHFAARLVMLLYKCCKLIYL